MVGSLIPSVPVPNFLDLEQSIIPRERKKPVARKHGAAYEAFCRWAALPRKLRRPKTQEEFEKLWHLPANYVHHWKHREDFQAARLKYFWNWMFDRFPDVVYAIYQRALRKSSADARIFTELIGKKLETERPTPKISPFMMIGVAQEDITKLFIPKEYDKVVEKTVTLHKAKVEDAIEVESV